MKSLTKSLIALSMAAVLSSSAALAADSGKCSASFGKINVVGQGEVKVMPDRARLNYRVSSIKPTADEARQEVEKTVTSFSKDVATLKLGDKAFVADSITIMPRYQWNEQAKKQELQGYEAARNVEIKIVDFGLIGQLNDMALKAGINEISGFQYTVEDPKKYQMEAAKKAIEDAKNRAKLLAEGFKVKVGSPCSLNFQERGYAVPYRNAAPRIMAAAADAGNQVQSTYTIEPLVISSAVEASFQIKD